MKITTSFKKQFETETLQSEMLRASILAVYALFTTTYIIIINFLIKADARLGGRTFKLPRTLLAFLAGLCIYEIITNRVLNMRLTRSNRSHPYFKYINAFIELAIISTMLYFYSVYFKDSSILSDIVLVSLYYLIVFLSAFYLDRIISIITGLIAAGTYIGLHLLEKRSVSSDGSSVVEQVLYNHYFVYVTGALLLLCGLASAFMANRLLKGIHRTVELVEEEHKMFNIFSKQISREVALEILDKDGKIVTENRFVTVMFIDIRDFTVYAEAHTPEEIVKFQNEYFGLVTKVVHKYDGIVNQFLGDGAMITFGAPVRVDNSAENAVKAALEIKDTIDRKIASGELHQFRIGIGIHCGMAVTGNIGTDVKSEYSITGGVVILAARIEPVNKVLGTQILISKDVLDKSGIKDLESESMGASHLKGWSQDVELYKLA
jgi:adenylate cyclase